SVFRNVKYYRNDRLMETFEMKILHHPGHETAPASVHKLLAYGFLRAAPSYLFDGRFVEDKCLRRVARKREIKVPTGNQGDAISFQKVVPDLNICNPDRELAHLAIYLRRSSLRVQKSPRGNSCGHCYGLNPRVVFQAVFENPKVIRDPGTGRQDHDIVFFESQIFALHEVQLVDYHEHRHDQDHRDGKLSDH